MGYKVNPVTGEMSEYIFEIGGIMALRNFTARTIGERLIIESATNANFVVLDAFVGEVQIDGVVYDDPIAAQEALQRLVFNPHVPVLMTLAQQQLLLGALQKGDYSGTASELKQHLENLISNKVTQVPGKGLSSNDFTDSLKADILANKNKRVVDFTITGDVNKALTLIYNDGTTKQKNFTDIVGQSGADVMLNSLNFNKDSGILTGVRSDGQQITADLNGRWALLNHTHQDLVAKTEIKKVIDVTTVDSTGNFKTGSGSIIPHISNDGVFSIHAGEIGSGDLIFEAKKSGVTIPKYLHVKHIRAEKLRISKSGSTWLDMDSRNNELNVFSPSNENVYVPVKASGFKVPNGNKGKVFASDGSQLLFTKGVDVSTSTYQPNNNHIESSTIFLTGSGDKTINLHELENHTVLSFKKCYDGGVITFVCNGKTLVIRGADAFNGADGSNAVISIVDNKCYIDINNYE